MVCVGLYSENDTARSFHSTGPSSKSRLGHIHSLTHKQTHTHTHADIFGEHLTGEDDNLQRAGSVYNGSCYFNVVYNYLMSSFPLVVIELVSLWCIDVPLMVAISLTGLLVHILHLKIVSSY